MKKFEVSALGLQELGGKDLRTNGGELISLAIALIGATIYIYNNWDDFVDGVKEGYEQTR